MSDRHFAVAVNKAGQITQLNSPDYERDECWCGEVGCRRYELPDQDRR